MFEQQIVDQLLNLQEIHPTRVDDTVTLCRSRSTHRSSQRTNIVLSGIKPRLPQVEHIPIRKHLQNLAPDALRLELVRPPQLPLASDDPRVDADQGELGVGPQVPEDLPEREPLADEQSLALGRGDGDGGRRDAEDARAALEVHLALLVDRVRGGRAGPARACFGVDALDGDRAREECAKKGVGGLGRVVMIASVVLRT